MSLRRGPEALKRRRLLRAIAHEVMRDWREMNRALPWEVLLQLRLIDRFGELNAKDLHSMTARILGDSR